MKEEEMLRLKYSKMKASWSSWEKEDDLKIEITKRKKGGIKISLIGFCPIPEIEEIKCDLGHTHKQFKKESFVYESLELDIFNKEELLEWLTKDPELWEPKPKEDNIVL